MLWTKPESRYSYYSRIIYADHSWCCQTPPSLLEWVVIPRYSPRIQELTLGTEYLSLHFLQCTNLALPNLRVLRWEHSRVGQVVPTSDHNIFLRLLLTSRITTLEMTWTSFSDANFRSFLETYPLLCPDLKSIKFSFLSRDRHLVPATTMESVSRAICCRADWQRVELSCP